MLFDIYCIKQTWRRTRTPNVTFGQNRPKRSGIMRTYSIKSDKYYLFRKQQEFWKKCAGNKIHDYIFFHRFYSEMFLFESHLVRQTAEAKCHFIIIYFHKNQIAHDILVILSSTTFNKNPSCASRVFTCGQTNNA